MIIDGVEYRPVDDSGSKLQIIVAHRGWVFVGQCEDVDGDAVVSNAKNIRRWGTTSGLGQLASDGPQSETVLDAAGIVRIPVTGVVCRFDCEVSKWT